MVGADTMLSPKKASNNQLITIDSEDNRQGTTYSIESARNVAPHDLSDYKLEEDDQNYGSTAKARRGKQSKNEFGDTANKFPSEEIKIEEDSQQRLREVAN